MKAVLMSIKPRWCELIASGKKTVEVRKTRPKLYVPFKVYIYCTKSKDSTFFTEQVFEGEKGKWAIPYVGNGKVIGEFVCYKIDKIFQCNSGWVQEHACISREEYFKYLGLPYNSHFDSKGAYAWHITDLVIYDEPRELGEFLKATKVFPTLIKDIASNGYRYNEFYYPLTRPPQSWCYVERSESDGQ